MGIKGRRNGKSFLEAVLDHYLQHAFFNDRTKGFPCMPCHCIVAPTTTVIDLPSKLLIVEAEVSVPVGIAIYLPFGLGSEIRVQTA